MIRKEPANTYPTSETLGSRFLGWQEPLTGSSQVQDAVQMSAPTRVEGPKRTAWGKNWLGHKALVTAGLRDARYDRSRLVPRWLSAWGLLAIASLVVSVVLVISGAIEPMSQPQVLLAAPIGVQEMVLAGWLIAKGFRPADAVAAEAPVEADLTPSAQATAA